VSCQSK